MKKTIQKGWRKVSYDDSVESKNKVFNRLMEYFNKHEAYDGDTIQQSNRPSLDAVVVLSDIADDLFECEWGG